jgi:cyclase
MGRARVIPCLLLKGGGLVKTVRFNSPTYVGDPRNAIKIFNEKEVDELVVLDIAATIAGRPPDFTLVSELTSECFMPMAYGGGISTLRDIERLLKTGVEKTSLNTAAFENPLLVSEAARALGSQSIVVSVDVRRGVSGKSTVFTRAGTRDTGVDPVDFAKAMENAGAGEIFLTSIDRDGTMGGYDLDLTRKVSEAVTVPVIACGGAGRTEDLGRAVREGGASAAAAGSIFVFHGPHRAVLISFPRPSDLDRILA